MNSFICNRNVILLVGMGVGVEVEGLVLISLLNLTIFT